MEFRAGEKVDRYTLVEGLGKGGQGTVWKVIDQLDRSLKAVKFIDLTQLPPTAVERARREAKAVTELRDHPAIVPCHVLFDLPGKDLLGLVFDLVQGTALANLMNDPRMTQHHRGAMLRQIASALAHVHSRGLVHRDIKPANVIVTEAFWSAPDQPGTVKLVDFGIVAPVNDTKRITVEHHPVGTAPYLAPELLLPSRWQSPPESFTQDIFAFGVLGFDLLSGMHPTGLPILANAQHLRMLIERPTRVDFLGQRITWIIHSHPFSFVAWPSIQTRGLHRALNLLSPWDSMRRHVPRPEQRHTPRRSSLQRRIRVYRPRIHTCFPGHPRRHRRLRGMGRRHHDKVIGRIEKMSLCPLLL